MLLAHGDVWEMASRPITAGLLYAAAALLVVAVMPTIRRRRDRVFTE